MKPSVPAFYTGSKSIRHSIYVPTLLRAARTLLRAGLSLPDIHAATGVPVSNLHRWLMRVGWANARDEIRTGLFIFTGRLNRRDPKHLSPVPDFAAAYRARYCAVAPA